MRKLVTVQKRCKKTHENQNLNQLSFLRTFHMCEHITVHSYGIQCSIIQSELECGPMPNVMVALPNIGGALCSTPQSLADAHY